jgi:uncharacterized protein
MRRPRLFLGPSNIHGLGLFAGEDIEWGLRLIDYQGQVLSEKEVKRRQRFYDSIGFSCLIQFGDGTGIDGLIGGNEARFINHSSQPNVGALREDRWRITFYSLEDIEEGEELTFNYGFDPTVSNNRVTMLPEREIKEARELLHASPTRVFLLGSPSGFGSDR